MGSILGGPKFGFFSIRMHGVDFWQLKKNTFRERSTTKFHVAIDNIHFYTKVLSIIHKRSWVRCQGMKYFEILKNRSSLTMILRSFKLSILIDTYILYFEKNQHFPMCHWFDSRATRNLDFSRLKYIDHISESILWHIPTAQRVKISHSHKRDHFQINEFQWLP